MGGCRYGRPLRRRGGRRDGAAGRFDPQPRYESLVGNATDPGLHRPQRRLLHGLPEGSVHPAPEDDAQRRPQHGHISGLGDADAVVEAADEGLMTDLPGTHTSRLRHAGDTRVRGRAAGGLRSVKRRTTAATGATVPAPNAPRWPTSGASSRCPASGGFGPAGPDGPRASRGG